MHKIALFLDKVWNWLVVSSVDPQKTSLTVKGFLGTSVTVLMIVVGMTNIHIAGLSDILNLIIDQIMLAIQDVLGIVGVISTIVGIVRKIILSIKSARQPVV